MALGPISNLGAPAPQTPPARDVAQAQRAFFQAALGKVEAAPPIEPPGAQPIPAASTQTPAAEPPKTAYRPGSLLDIRI